MQYTFFAHGRPKHLSVEGSGIEFVDDPGRADIILSRFPEKLAPYDEMVARLAIWTQEPRFCAERVGIAHFPGMSRPVHLMTAHNGTIYKDCFYVGPSRQVDLDEQMAAFRSKPSKSVLLTTFRVPRRCSLVLDDVDIDLMAKRQSLAMLLHERGECDIFGKGWPEEIVSGESRGGAWQAAKQEILKGYKFNIALENTFIRHYVTEKIWDAVEGACLPIYHGVDSGIYDVFPEGSFVEAYGKSNEELADQIQSMRNSEAESRYEACLLAYQKSVGRRSISLEACRQRSLQFLFRVARISTRTILPKARWAITRHMADSGWALGLARSGSPNLSLARRKAGVANPMATKELDEGISTHRSQLALADESLGSLVRRRAQNFLNLGRKKPVSVADYLRKSDLAKFPFVFVVTYGRSGSTLLQGLLNSLPGYCIRGENRAALFHLFQAIESLRSMIRGQNVPESAWYGASLVSPSDFERQLVDLFFADVLQPPPTARCIGFKEIRFTPGHIKDDAMFDRYLDFIARVFPGAAFVFNVRNPEDTVRSKWWASMDRQNALTSMSRTIARMKNYAANSPTNTFMFDYDELVRNEACFEALCDFLGEAHSDVRVRDVLSRRHSY